jgi:hypothetical protein
MAADACQFFPTLVLALPVNPPETAFQSSSTGWTFYSLLIPFPFFPQKMVFIFEGQCLKLIKKTCL